MEEQGAWRQVAWRQGARRSKEQGAQHATATGLDSLLAHFSILHSLAVWSGM